MRLQKFPTLAAAILGILSVGTTELWARGGGFGGGGARFGGGGGRAIAGPRGFAAVRGSGFAAVRGPGFAGVAVRRSPAFVGERFHRFDHRRGLNHFVVAGGYPYYPYFPGYYNPAPFYDPYAVQNAYPPPIAESSTAALTPPCPGLVAGDVVGNVQRVLRYRGFYRGPIDGLSGPTTRAAIRAYDASVGLPPTGMIDARLLISMQLM